MALPPSGITHIPSLGELRAPTLDHVSESPKLAATLSQAVRKSLETGTTFPHTLLVGPADSGKQTLAATIAAELGAPLVYVSPESLAGPDELHAILAGVPSGAVVLVGALEGNWHVASEIGRVVRGEGVRRMPGPPWAMDGEQWKTPAAREKYSDFTIIATTRDENAENYTCTNWAELVLYTVRTQSTESARVGRMLRRVGLQPDSEALAALAGFAVAAEVRTLRLAKSVALWAERRGITSLDATSVDLAIDELCEQLVGPERLTKLRGSMAKADRGSVGSPARWGSAMKSAAPARDAATPNGSASPASVAGRLLIVGAVLAVAVFIAMAAFRWIFGA